MLKCQLFTLVNIETWCKVFLCEGLGEKSGFMGNLLALAWEYLGGSYLCRISISKTLLGKGASISNIVIILSSWAVIKVPMLANEAKFLSVNFMIIRWVLTVNSDIHNGLYHRHDCKKEGFTY